MNRSKYTVTKLLSNAAAYATDVAGYPLSPGFLEEKGKFYALETLRLARITAIPLLDSALHMLG